MKPILYACSIGLALAATATAQTSDGGELPPRTVVAIPAQFAVCVTTVDAKGRARLDSFWAALADAVTRRAEFLRNGWLTDGDEFDREDEYPPHSIVKATIDPTLINQPSCLPPEVRE
jgi:hypothetical protein